MPRDWESYLDRLQILLTAYALAGVQAVAGSPPANSENTVGADTTQFVQAPLEGRRPPPWGLFRNRLCSPSGYGGFVCGASRAAI